MKICIIGTGYVGLVTGVCFADLGNIVHCVDKDVTKIKQHPMINNKHINFKYAVKIKNLPFTIKIFCNYSNKIKKDYIRFLTNNFNKTFGILNQNTKIIFSKSDNPYN